MIHCFQACKLFSIQNHLGKIHTCPGIPCQGAVLCLVLVRAWDACLVLVVFFCIKVQSFLGNIEAAQLLRKLQGRCCYASKDIGKGKMEEEKRVKFCKGNLDTQMKAFLAAHRYKVYCLILLGFSVYSLNVQFCGSVSMKILVTVTQFKSPVLTSIGFKI